MTRPELLLLVGGLTAFGAFALFHHSASRQHVSVASSTKAFYDVPHPVPGLFQHDPSQLLQKEATLLSYCPAWEQYAWIHANRPGVYWSPQDNAYYFYGPTQFGTGALSLNVSFNNAYAPVQLPKNVSWYGTPLH